LTTKKFLKIYTLYVYTHNLAKRGKKDFKMSVSLVEELISKLENSVQSSLLLC